MSLYNLLYNTLFGLKDAVDGAGVYRTAAQLRKEQFLPVPELDELRRRRLLALLMYAREHSPYYRDLFLASNTSMEPGFQIDDLSRVPLLTRDSLQENSERLLCRDAVGHYTDASGGSTGQPVNFYHDQAYLHWGNANQMLHCTWMGVRPGDRTAVIWGADRDLQDESFRTRVMSKLSRLHMLNSFSMTEERIADFLQQLDHIRPRYIYGYASALYHVACFIASGRPIAFKPVAIKSSAEMLYDFQRTEIERAFVAPVFNFYGSREVNNVAAECEAHDGLHVFGSGRIVEIVDDAGQPLRPGEVGQIAVTDLVNRTFPFIRYLNGDLGALKEGLCSCGRTYPRLEKIVGRSSDIIEVAGQQIHGEYFTHLFYGNPGVRAFQLVQQTEREFTLLIVPRLEHLDVSFFRERLIEKLGQGITLNITLTERISPAAGGKHRFTISRLHSRAGESTDA